MPRPEVADQEKQDGKQQHRPHRRRHRPPEVGARDRQTKPRARHTRGANTDDARLEHFAIARDGVVQPPLPPEQCAKVDMRVDVVWPQRDRLAK